MIKQTLAFLNPAYLSLKNGQMMIDTQSDQGILSRPVEDIGLVVLESRCVTITTALLSALVDNNVAVMVCDSRHLPSGMMVPITSHTTNTERVRMQVSCSLPLKKQLWQQTVSAKIMNQGKLLKEVNPSEGSECMQIWARSVRSGDPDNLEARAAIFYWKNLFPNKSGFQRGDEGDVVNSYLNYGYSILRGVMARAIVGSGLIPQIGLFHSNKYNSYCLADDLMEPYRPIVDRMVWGIAGTYRDTVELTTEIKRQLLTVPTLDVVISGLRRPLMIACTMTASSLVKCFSGERRRLEYPDFYQK